MGVLMDNPSVCAVCLTADRQAYTDRALRCYQASTYPNRRLLILDSGMTPYTPSWPQGTTSNVEICRMEPLAKGGQPWTIGALRNEANEIADADIIIHMDSDDYSYPYRISEQVAALQELQAQGQHVDAVGDRNVTFWDSIPTLVSLPSRMSAAALESGAPQELVAKGEAWQYADPRPWYCVGASLAYWRTAWERERFADCHVGEDHDWLKRVTSCGFNRKSWIIAEIHGGNTSPSYKRQPGSHGFTRVPHEDERIRAIIESA